MTDTGRPPRRTPKLAISAAALIAVGALAFGGFALTNAWFTSQATVTGQSVSTATVEIAADLAANTPPIAATAMAPGDEAQTTIAVTNTGSEDVYFAVGPFTATGHAGLRGALEVTVIADGATATHTLAEWEERQFEGFSLAAGALTQVTVIVELPETGADQNALQSKSAAFSIAFDAIQQSNQPARTPNWVSPE